MSTTKQTTAWLCQICFESFEVKDHTPVKVVDDNVCEECFKDGMKPQFEEALKNQSKYPVTWGTTTLEVENYTRFFSPEFMRKWSTTTKEYAVSTKARIYCTQQVRTISNEEENHSTQKICGAFLGSFNDHATETTIKCTKCHGNLELSKLAKDSSVFFLDGQVRGKDYQLCPTKDCGTVIFLEDGCNEVRCDLCKTTLCYVCGTEPSHDHWVVGQPCPRFGHPTSDRAIYDGQTANEPEDDDEDDENDHDVSWPSRALIRVAHNGIALTDAQEDVIFSSSVGLLLLADSWRFVVLAEPRGGRDSDPMIRDLILGLWRMSNLYIAHLVPEGMFPIRWQGDRGRRAQHREILRLFSAIPAERYEAYPGLVRLFHTHGHAWAGTIETHAAALAQAESDAISHSVENQLLVADLHLLDVVHERWIASPMGGMAMEAAHELIHLLLGDIDIYIDHLFDQDIPRSRPGLWERRRRRTARVEIHHAHRLMSASPAVVAAFPELSAIVASHGMVWNSQFETLRQQHPRNL